MKNALRILFVLLVTAPLITVAADTTTGALNLVPAQNLSNSIIGLINTVAVPFIFAVAFLVFIWGVFQYFILGGANEEKRKEGAQMVMYGVIGFAVMISIWGLVRILVGTIPGLAGQNTPPIPCLVEPCTEI